MDCLFCKIVSKDIPNYTIYEDDRVIAFLDINPHSNGHTLVVPKKHCVDIIDIDNNELSYLLAKTKEISNNINNSLKPNGIKIVENNGDIQDIKHFHIHIVPYYKKKQELRDFNEIKNIMTKK